MSEVTAYLSELEHSRTSQIRKFNKAIQAGNPDFAEEIKWNAPSFVLGRKNVLTFRLFPDPTFEVIFHVGSKKLTQPPDLRFEIENYDHKWADMTRCVITISEKSDPKLLLPSINKWKNVISEKGLTQ